MKSSILEPHLPAIRDLCTQYKVLELLVFGSVLRADFDGESDIDFLVVFDRKGYHGAFQQFMDFREALETLLGRPVDLLVRRKFRNDFFDREIQRTQQRVYAA